MSSSGSTPTLRVRAAELFTRAQEKIRLALEAADGGARFREDSWERGSASHPSPPAQDRPGITGGGGRSLVIQGGRVFEKGGVNFSSVEGLLPPAMARHMIGTDEPQPFYATGISLIMHPASPQVPTVHANYRYIQAGRSAWFGGGADLTPYVLYDEDAEHFHRVLKASCDRYDPAAYPAFKKQCDEYFYLPHRNETRGIGGIFFDYVGRDDPSLLEPFFTLVTELAPGFVDAYLPIVERRKAAPFSESEKHFQLLRRGRYVEFNLLYDRGTQFGLQTGGRTESILVSLPLEVRWEYDVKYPAAGPEARLLEVLARPRDWIRG